MAKKCLDKNPSINKPALLLQSMQFMTNKSLKWPGILLALLCSLSVKAQNKLGLFAGPQITWAKYRVDYTKQDVTQRNGFVAGINYKVAFDKQLYFAPALFYSKKGYNVTFDKPSTPPAFNALNNQTEISTAAIALLLQFDFSEKPNHFFIKGGPSIDFSVSGKEKFDTIGSNKSYSRPMVFSTTNYGYVTTAMNLHFGYESKTGLFLSAFYEHGMGNFNNNDGGPEIRHRVAGLNLGYYFLKGKQNR
jgi:hypothetical protein